MLPLYDDQPSRGFPFATVLIIAANTAIFYFWQLRITIDKSVDIGGLVPIVFVHSHWLTGVSYMISSMFMHGGWMHLIGNMWFLFVFGKGVEGMLGAARFLVFYIVCGIAADYVYIYFSPRSEI